MAKFPRLPSETVLLICDMARQGSDVQLIAVSFDLEPAHVVQILKEQGIQVGRMHARLVDRYDQQDLDDMVRLYQSGRDVDSICKLYDLSPHNFYYLLRELGVPTRQLEVEKVTGRQLLLDKAMEMYVGGLPYWKISLETGLDPSDILRERHLRGLPGRIKPRR